jgi:DNA topoisomerase III
MKKLILTEKPSVARDFAQALNTRAFGNGFFEGEQYIITWAIGHILTPFAPEDYDKKWKKWDLESLPILPEKFQYRPNQETKSQLTTIVKLLKRKDIGEIIVATDAGREGELIARNILHLSKSKMKTSRFWTSQALTKEVILEELNNRQDLKKYDPIYWAGVSRQMADWYVGMNLSRICTLKLNHLYSVGRVQTTVLSLLVERELERQKHQTQIFFVLNALHDHRGQKLKSTWIDLEKSSEESKKLTEIEGNKIINKIDGKIQTITSVEEKKREIPPPQLHSLTELQKAANRIYQFSAQRTLNIAQSLYEKRKCISYPRTDSKVLGDKSFPQVKKLLKTFKNDTPNLFSQLDESKISLANKRVFNNQLLTDHHALMPLKFYDFENSQTDEAKIYGLIYKRFIAAFSQNHIYEDQKIMSTIENENFISQGKKLIHPGWKAVEYLERFHTLPALLRGSQGEQVELNLEERKTLPPPLYTEASLLHRMSNPSVLVEEKELKDIFRTNIGLGTQSTRAQIIETLLKRQYVQRKGKNLIPLEKGIYLIKVLKTFPISKTLTLASETAKWEEELENIAVNSVLPKDFIKAIKHFINTSVEEWKEFNPNTIAHIKAPILPDSPTGPKKAGTFQQQNKEALGNCPKCKGQVLEGPKSYSCENWRTGCKFTIWKTIAKKKISKSQAKKIIKNGLSDQLKGFKSKAGKDFEAKLKLEKDGQVTFSFQ